MKSRPLMPDLILDQTSGLTLVLLHFCSSQVCCCLKDFLSTYYLTTFSGSFYLLSWQVLGPHHLRSYSVAMDPKKSLSTVFSDFSLSLFCLWHLHFVGAGLWLSSESLGEPLQCPKTMTLICVKSPRPCPGRLRL